MCDWVCDRIETSFIPVNVPQTSDFYIYLLTSSTWLPQLLQLFNISCASISQNDPSETRNEAKLMGIQKLMWLIVRHPSIVGLVQRWLNKCKNSSHQIDDDHSEIHVTTSTTKKKRKIDTRELNWDWNGTMRAIKPWMQQRIQWQQQQHQQKCKNCIEHSWSSVSSDAKVKVRLFVLFVYVSLLVEWISCAEKWQTRCLNRCMIGPERECQKAKDTQITSRRAPISRSRNYFIFSFEFFFIL